MERAIANRGFTLIELLVVVSIIALLISILLPTINQTQVAAKISADVQSLKQHGIGSAAYAAANKDSLPNAPDTPPGLPRKYGIADRLAQEFATDAFPVNGFAFPTAGIPTYKPILQFENGGLPNNAWRWDNASMFNGYFIVMGEYMTDGEGIDAMQDVFFAQGDTDGRAMVSKAKKYLQTSKGQWPGLNATNILNANFRTGSFRYVAAGVLDPKVMKCSQPGVPDLNTQFNLRTQLATGEENQSKFYSYVTRVPQSAVSFPSSKVLFFCERSFYVPKRDWWFEPQAICPVAAADGSARGATNERDALIDRANGFKEDAGNWVTVVFENTDEETGKSTTVEYDFPYVVTYGGIRGRDLN